MGSRFVDDDLDAIELIKDGYDVHHWDTFDNETVLLQTLPTLEAAVAWAEEHYGNRICATGADKVDIVHGGKIVWQRAVR